MPASASACLRMASAGRSMSPEERDKARRGLRRFEHMSPEQREQARALFGQMRNCRRRSATHCASAGRR
jgi:hypothetical protein